MDEPDPLSSNWIIVPAIIIFAFGLYALISSPIDCSVTLSFAAMTVAILLISLFLSNVDRETALWLFNLFAFMGILSVLLIDETEHPVKFTKS